MKQIVEFDIQDLLPIGITIGILGVSISYIATLNKDVQTETFNKFNGVDSCNSGSEANISSCPGWNISTASLKGTQKIGENIPLIVGAVVIAVVIGILLRYFVFGQGR